MARRRVGRSASSPTRPHHRPAARSIRRRAVVAAAGRRCAPAFLFLAGGGRARSGSARTTRPPPSRATARRRRSTSPRHRPAGAGGRTGGSKRVEHSWAGLAELRAGPASGLRLQRRAVRGFFWCAGQGGFGIQTAPAAAALAAALLLGRAQRRRRDRPGALSRVAACLEELLKTSTIPATETAQIAVRSHGMPRM